MTSSDARISTHPPRTARWSPPEDWRQILGLGSAREVLSRIVSGDPLGMRRLVAERIRGRSLLLDADRVHLRALARCAHAPRRDAREGTRASTRWLVQQADAAIDDCLARSARRLDSLEDDPASTLAELARPLGLQRRVAARVCAQFNACDETERAAFFALLIDRLELAQAARTAGVPAIELAKRARRALEQVLGSVPRDAFEAPEPKARGPRAR